MKNFVQLIGRVGETPKSYNFEKGKSSARFSLATNSSYKNAKGEWVESTSWHKIITWNKLAERASEQLEKGKKIMIEGALQYRIYEDKEGIKRTITEINAQKMILL